MARTRRNPESRRSELIDAATKLFFSRGYTATSIRDILDAVDDGTASPSVFCRGTPIATYRASRRPPQSTQMIPMG